MAEQRQPFRFRLPWLTATAAPRPAVESQPPRPTVESQPPRPTAETQPPTQPATAIPAQRPPFRPPGIAPAQPFLPQARAPPRTEPQPPSRAATESQVTSQPASPSRATSQIQGASLPPSPSRAATESRVTLQPASPSRTTTQTRTSSLPPSPSRAVSQSRVASVPPSPSRATSKTEPALQTNPQPQYQSTGRTSSQPSSPSRSATQVQPTVPPSPSLAASKTEPTLQTQPQSQSTGRTSSQPSSPSRSATQVQPTAGAVFLPPSPSKKLQPITQESSQPQPPSSASQQEEPKPTVSQALSQEPQPKAEITSKTVLDVQNQTMRGTAFQNWVATRPSQASGPVTVAVPTSAAAPETIAQTQKLDFNTIRADPKPLSESETKMEEPEERNKGVKELTKEAKSNGSASEEPTRRTITELLTAATGSGRQTRDLQSAAFKTEQKQQEKQEIFDRKNIVITSSTSEKQIKSASATHPNDRHRVNESQQKPVISNGERAPLHKEIREDISKFVHKLATGQPKQPMEEKPVSVITLAGDNRGASMHIGSQSAKKEGSVHIHRGYKVNPDENTEATTDGEGSSKGRKSNDSVTKEDSATRAYINSNIQSINNSILFNSSVTERNPGVQLVSSHNAAEPMKSDTKSEPLETHKAEFNVTPAQKLTYEPTIRRRCLRGLFMEPSDSDPDDPEKPRRHGCRYNCGDNTKDKEIGVL